MLNWKKAGTAAAAALMLAGATIATSQPAEARGGRIAAGVIGGLAVGALVGSALAAPSYYGPGYYYGPGPVYYAPPRCWWERERVWDGYGWRLHRVRVCE